MKRMLVLVCGLIFGLVAISCANSSSQSVEKPLNVKLPHCQAFVSIQESDHSTSGLITTRPMTPLETPQIYQVRWYTYGHGDLRLQSQPWLIIEETPCLKAEAPSN